MLFETNVVTLVLFAMLSFVKTSYAQETHTIMFINNCGFGMPILEQNGNILSTGETVTFNGPLLDVIAFLDTGNCGADGEGCTVIDFSLANSNASVSGSSADILLISPYAFSVTSGFGYFNGCDGSGFDCTNAECQGICLDCPVPSPACCTQVSCDVDNVSVVITFCD